MTDKLEILELLTEAESKTEAVKQRIVEVATQTAKVYVKGLEDASNEANKSLKAAEEANMALKGEIAKIMATLQQIWEELAVRKANLELEKQVLEKINAELSR